MENRIRTRYYAYYPNNFGNEYTVIKVETQEELEKLEKWSCSLDYAQRSLNRITLAELKEMASDERWRKKNDIAFSGYANYEPISVGEFFNEA